MARPEASIVEPSARAPDRNLALELVRVTEAAAMGAGRWIGRGDKESADQAAVDPREGGAWSVTAVGDAGGPSIPFVGTFGVVDPPARLVITLDNEPSPDAVQHSELEVILHAVPDGTRMEFHHHGFGDQADLEELRGGYAGVFFPALAAYLASAS